MKFFSRVFVWWSQSLFIAFYKPFFELYLSTKIVLNFFGALYITDAYRLFYCIFLTHVVARVPLILNFQILHSTLVQQLYK